MPDCTNPVLSIYRYAHPSSPAEISSLPCPHFPASSLDSSPSASEKQPGGDTPNTVPVRVGTKLPATPFPPFQSLPTRHAAVTIFRHGPLPPGCKTQLPLPVAHRRLQLKCRFGLSIAAVGRAMSPELGVLVLDGPTVSRFNGCQPASHIDRCHAGPSAIITVSTNQALHTASLLFRAEGVPCRHAGVGWFLAIPPLICCHQLARVRTGIGRTGPYRCCTSSN